MPRSLTRPRPGADDRSRSGHPTLGILLGVIGVGPATIALIANFAAAGVEGPSRAATLAWSSGLTTTAFATVKVGIAVVLVGILVQLWLRVDSLRSALPALEADAEPAVVSAALSGRARPSPRAPGHGDPGRTPPLVIHRLAQALWAPMLAMGAMAVFIGLIVSFVWAGGAAVAEVDLNPREAETTPGGCLVRILLCSAFNGLSQRAWIDLRAAGHDVSVRLAGDADAIRSDVAAVDPDLVVCPLLRERVPTDVVDALPDPHRPPRPGGRSWPVVAGLGDH